jgi:RNA polymerase sigma factor (sigma-70 family)
MARQRWIGQPGVSEASHASTLTLVRRGIEGNLAACDEAFQRLVPRIRRWTHRRLWQRLRTVDDSMDLLQSVVLGFWRNRHRVRLERAGDLDAYIRESVRRRIINLAQRAHRSPETVCLNFDLPSDGRSPLEQAIREFERLAVQRALARVSEDDRVLILARFEMGYSYTQIAGLYRLPSCDAARMAVNRALVRLRHQLESNGR